MEISDKVIRLFFVEYMDDCIYLEGIYDKNQIESFYLSDGKNKQYNLLEDTAAPKERSPFKFKVMCLEDEIQINFCSDNENHLPFSFGKFFPIQKRYKHAYYWKNGFCLFKGENGLRLKKSSKRLHFEVELMKEMLFRGGKRGKKDFVIRIAGHCLGKFRGKKWVISDRPDRGGDNGEALFKYACAHKENRCYFAIKENSQDYIRLKKIGRVIPFGGLRYKLLYLSGATMISSQAEDVIFRPLKGNTAAVADLMYHKNFVFLQHGITKDDLSGWLNRYNKNIGMFVCATRLEYDSILNGAYGYSPENVRLTGFPRHDLLKNSPQRMITVMFTWRYDLVELPDKKTGLRYLKEGFETSDYYQMMAVLLTDTRLKQFLEEYKYKMRFVLHPCMEQAMPYFEKLRGGYEVITKADYQEIFKTSDLIITDYSSVAFDFALLRKPIIYCQPDKEMFFKNHMYGQGYYDYQRDGFGEVTYTVGDCLNVLYQSVKNGCRLDEKYRQRIDRTFPYGNEGNSQRVCDAIHSIF